MRKWKIGLLTAIGLAVTCSTAIALTSCGAHLVNIPVPAGVEFDIKAPFTFATELEHYAPIQVGKVTKQNAYVSGSIIISKEPENSVAPESGLLSSSIEAEPSVVAAPIRLLMASIINDKIFLYIDTTYGNVAERYFNGEQEYYNFLTAFHGNYLLRITYLYFESQHHNVFNEFYIYLPIIIPEVLAPVV